MEACDVKWVASVKKTVDGVVIDAPSLLEYRSGYEFLTACRAMASWDFESDFCVVGAGSGGSVVAARIAEDDTSVLLLEAGPRDWNPFIHIPAGYFYLLKDPRFNWMYGTEPEATTMDRQITYPAGRGLGGSSSINGILFARGQAAEYDWMANELGCKGWDYLSLLPYFKKAETFEGDPSQHRGQTGPVNVARFRTVHPLARDFVKAATQAGFAEVTDMNAANREGASLFQQNRRGRFRHSTASAYLRPTIKRGRRLRVETNATCSRILLAGKKVEGIEYIKDGRTHRVRVRREVIVSCGALRSPQLLQLSGIGDPNHLSKIGVPTLHSLPSVGMNLKDQFLVRVSHRTKGALTINEMNNFASITKEAFKYVAVNRGLLTLGASMAALYCRSSAEAKFADLMIMFAPVSFSPKVPGVLEKEGGMTTGVILSCPNSSGSVRARSADPNERPSIAPNFLTDERDWARMLVGVRTARKVFEMDALKRWSVGETTPGRAVESDEALYAYARSVGSTAAHYAGTCRMGDDDNSVTDPLLRVRGLEGLRVVDNSVLPSPISGGMNATAIGVAERASDIIRGRLR
ncbi:GMC family oxidoreductase N-terminal domain-containing protein [Mesorhizobium sp.]|uniref:GMC family oxidoreductase n=1 Tax=Mesorhizobium sp. TaxID=1871066 RepID=UPI0025BA4FEE|nr:GMC family oxidoreductase N-terminal domain-containing protein [Mesorhizobium sp.]